MSAIDRPTEQAQIWLRIAQTDLAYAEIGVAEGFYRQACFGSQQVAEKALKAYLFAQRQPLLPIHVLPRLRGECEHFDADFQELTDACDILTAYYIDTRYPDAGDALEAYDEAVAQEAVELARQVLEFVWHKVQEMHPGLLD